MLQPARTATVCVATVCVTFALVTLTGLNRLSACPFCSAPSLTLSEQLAQSDAAVLVQWVTAEKPEDDDTGQTVYEIREVVRGPSELLKKEDRITMPRYRAGQKGDLFLLLGTRGTKIEWSSPLEVTETSYNYIIQAPSPEAPTEKRLEYFLKFLEFPNRLISNDAYAEFANAPYDDITPLAEKLPRKKLRKWVTSSETPVSRLGLYGLMLGLCGNEEDAKRMQEEISKSSGEFRLGIEGVMSGYLLLTRDEGLDYLVATKLTDPEIPFSETYAAMQALRFMWTYAEGEIAKDRLREAMRVLLDRPELADLVIADLARWKDWEVQDRLMDLYGAEEYNIPSIKRAIIRYLLVCSKAAPKESDVSVPQHVVKARKHLEALRKEDPKTVQQAERFFFLK